MKKPEAIYIQSDKYFNHPGEYDDLADMMGVDAQAIDINGAFVPKDKLDPDNLKNAEETLHHRFKPGN